MVETRKTRRIGFLTTRIQIATEDLRGNAHKALRSRQETKGIQRTKNFPVSARRDGLKVKEAGPMSAVQTNGRAACLSSAMWRTLAKRSFVTRHVLRSSGL